MLMNLAIMDWVIYSHLIVTYGVMVWCMVLYLQNENVHRVRTNERLVQDLRRRYRRSPMKVLVKKSFDFVEIWKAYTFSQDLLH